MSIFKKIPAIQYCTFIKLGTQKNQIKENNPADTKICFCL